MGYNKVFVAGQPLNTDFLSVAQQVLDGQVYSVQIAFTGDVCNFTASIQTSSDAYNNTVGFMPEHIDTLEDSPQTITEAGTFTWNVTAVGYNWVILNIVDNSSGTNDGNLLATINVKN